MKNKQIDFFDYLKTTKASDAIAIKKRTVHGGSKTKGKRKLARPLSKKRPIHITLKSKKAVGPLSFLSMRNKMFVAETIKAKAAKFHLKLHDFANVGNHLHIKVRPQSREGFQKFLKSVTCLIARHVTGARRGKSFGKFWDGLAFTRILKSSFEELQLKGYFHANRIQAQHSYQKRTEFLSAFNNWVYALKRAESGP